MDSAYSNYSEPDPEYWCPTCVEDDNSLDIDPRAVLKYCSRHRPDFSGELDNDVTFGITVPLLVTGGTEARDICNLIHRGSINPDGS
jgi:hypothetical protein